jgi:hypothetical protein
MESPQRIERQLAGAVYWCVLGLFVGLALVLLMRRLVGVFIHPLGGPAIFGISLAGAATAAVLRAGLVVRRHESGAVLSTQYLVLGLLLLPGIACVLLLAALSVPGTALLPLVASWLLLIAAEAATWILLYQGGWPITSVDRAEPEVPSDLVQQLTRTVENGRETLHALLRVEIPSNDRQAVAHLAFCPPLAATPELAAHVIDGEQAEVRVTQAESFGTRLEIRAAQTASETRKTLVEVVGSASVRPSA